MSALRAILLLSALFAPRTLLAQSSADVPDVVVHGMTFKETEKLVEALAPSPDNLQLVRWNGSICPQVVGLSASQSAYLRRRIAEEAALLDVDMAPEHCHGNVIIIFTSHPDALIADTLKHYPGVIRDVERFGLPHAKERAPYLVPRPVRWFMVSHTGMGDGDIPTMPSRISLDTRENATLSYVIVDDYAVDGVKWSQLADYLTMVTLGRPAIDGDFSNTDSILSLFAERDKGKSAPAGLTEQDRAFLHALYRSNATLSPDEQRNQIARAMMQAVKPVHKEGG